VVRCTAFGSGPWVPAAGVLSTADSANTINRLDATTRPPLPGMAWRCSTQPKRCHPDGVAS
jgi:hypothetical protein